jgi:L-glyceraldehyde 3-phosphate reductase
MYVPIESRYAKMKYNRCGQSGLKLPAVSLGLWHNFGYNDKYENSRAMVCHAFDLGITHFDLANNYGPPPGSAEETMGRILKTDLAAYRDQLVISSKAGYDMWPGPYGDHGSRKYLIASLDQSLRRLGLEYVDIFYHHRPDVETPLEETMRALEDIMSSGKAIYVGISNYNAEQLHQAEQILNSFRNHCLIHQPKYSMFERTIENGLLDVYKKDGIGCITFSPLAQGLLTDKYLHGIPEGSRASKPSGFLRPEDISPEKIAKVQKLNELAKSRKQSLAQMAITWIMRHKEVTSVLIGASRTEQIDDIVKTLDHPALSAEELKKIDDILK